MKQGGAIRRAIAQAKSLNPEMVDLMTNEESCAFRTALTQGFYLLPVPLAEHGYRHTVCGQHEIPGAWCPNCEKPLLRFFSFDPSDARIPRIGGGVPIDLVYCWTCNISQRPFLYQLLPGGGVKLLRYGEGGVEHDFPYEDYPPYFPESLVNLLELTPDEQALIRQINADVLDIPLDAKRRLTDPQHQLGGEPYLIQSNWEDWMVTECPLCQGPMVFLASVGDTTVDGRGFTHNIGVQVLFSCCEACAVIGASQQCD
jgi:hypothetical protein